jgi:hypothetical protein
MRFEPGDRGPAELGMEISSPALVETERSRGRTRRGSVEGSWGGSDVYPRAPLLWSPPSPVLDPDRRAHETERVTDLIFQEALVGEM